MLLHERFNSFIFSKNNLLVSVINHVFSMCCCNNFVDLDENKYAKIENKIETTPKNIPVVHKITSIALYSFQTIFKVSILL